MEYLGEMLLVAAVALSVPLGKLLAQLLKQAINLIKHENLRDAALALVIFAEKTFLGKGNGESKFAYVAKRLSSKFEWASEQKIKEFIETAHTSFEQNLNADVKKKLS